MILIFVGKRVGSTLLSYLISRPERIGYVVAASDTDEAIRGLCQQNNIPCSFFDGLDIGALRSVTTQYEWLLDLWSPHILSNEILALAKPRANLHPSLVPHARGADSTAWCIRKGLPAGVSILEMTEVVDAGGLYAQKQLQVEFPVSGKQLHERLQDEMIEFFPQVWPLMLAGEIKPQPQPAGGSLHRRKETNEDRKQKAEASMTLGEAVRWMLAHDFHPGTTAELEQDGQRFKLQLTVTKIAEI
jgi:folate-dependent phosphoribosylglycinamide formyltransferase PurN